MILREGLITLSPGMPVGPSYVCFLVLSVAVASVPPHKSGRGQLAEGCEPRVVLALGRGQLVSTPRAYQLPLSLLEAVLSTQQASGECWLSRGIQDLGRVGEMVGSTSRSREDARGAEKMPLEQQGRLHGCWGWGSADRGLPAAQEAKKGFLLPGGHLLPGELGLKTTRGVTVSDTTERKSVTPAFKATVPECQSEPRPSCAFGDVPKCSASLLV